MNKSIKVKVSDISKTTKNEIYIRKIENDCSQENSKDKKQKLTSNMSSLKKPIKITFNLQKTNKNDLKKFNSIPKKTETNFTNLNKKPINIKEEMITEIAYLNEVSHKRNKTNNQLYVKNNPSKASNNTFLLNTNHTKSNLSQTKMSIKISEINENTLKDGYQIKSFYDENNLMGTQVKPKLRENRNHILNNNSILINKLNFSSTRHEIHKKILGDKKTFSPSLNHVTHITYKADNLKNKSNLSKKYQENNETNFDDDIIKKTPSKIKISKISNSNSIKKEYDKTIITGTRKKFIHNLNFSLNKSKEKSTKKQIDKSFDMTMVDNSPMKNMNNSFINKIKANKLKYSEANNDQKHSNNATKVNPINLSSASDEKSNRIELNLVLEKYGKVLKQEEIDELRKAKEIYFLGALTERLNTDNLLYNLNIIEKESNGASNQDESIHQLANSKLNDKVNNDDEEKGNFFVKKGDHILYRYEILDELGKGSFGQALKCYDHKNNIECCVKIINKNKNFISQAKMEIKILKYIKKADSKNETNIVQIHDHFIFRNHICIVSELLDTNLYEFLKKQDFKGLDIGVIRKIALQLLYSLIFLKKHSIIHCDLKLENILLRKKGKTGIKIIDFGSSCFESEKLYSYIQSRFYRAPEIILGIRYGIEIDMWSFGCVMAELFNGIPIFPGENERDQLNYIMEYLGVPANEMIHYSKKRNKFFDENMVPLRIPNTRGKIRMPNTKKIKKFLDGADENFINFVSKCLELDLNKRIKPEDAILHPWIISGIPKEILSFHKNLIEQNQIKEKSNPLIQKPMSELKNTHKSNFLMYQTQINKIESSNHSTIKGYYKNKLNKSENSYNNKTK